jgi:fatty-acyl-CoA synthase
VPVSPRIEVRVVDPDTGEPLPHERPGELQVRGYNVMGGYLGNPEATAAALTPDGWFRTGDLGSTREHGFLFTSRLRDSLRLRGYLVDPAEIEEYLAGHGAVAAAQVVGVQQPGRGDVAVAFVRRGPGPGVSEAELLTWCRRGLAGYKVPERIVLVEDFPMTHGPNGAKVQKVALRGMAEALLNERP